MIFSAGDEGLIEDFLLELKQKDLVKTKAIEKYGFATVIRSFYSLPCWMPLRIKSQHGVCLWQEIPPSELAANERVMLVFSKRWLNIWKKAKTKKLVLGLPNPFILYKRAFNVRQHAKASGSVFFYAHSTASDFGEVDNASIIQLLREIPSDFGECVIAMHYVDMLRGEYREFLDAGFKVFCAGHYSDSQFVVRFYDMLSSRKYALSNAIGSHYFYCVEHGLPFSYVGFAPKYKNVGYDASVWQAVERARKHVSGAYQLTPGFVREISAEQLKSVEYELGAGLHVSRNKFYFVLLYATFFDALLSSLRKFSALQRVVRNFLRR